ncbi:hypothetical protein [Paradevosia shaoguanensis]|uniref:hypothetical protein n=1 Tax=Paradevosia shaoguanensis TaxID=1335043 RepID=UPI0019338B20|nr:hypothetical protein [Paradevosia shaoguanensis]
MASEVKHTPGPIKVGRFGSRNLYLGPNRNAPAMRLSEAKAAFSHLATLRAHLADEIAYSMATGFGDHAKIGRLDAAIAKAEGK